MGQTITDPINRMMTRTEYISYTKYVIDRHLGLDQSGSVWSYYTNDPINWAAPTVLNYNIIYLVQQKYGVDQIRFTHSKNAAIHASTKRDDAIRYLSLHDNKFIRYFTGHTKRVISLEMSPADDSFISGGLDNSVNILFLRRFILL